MLPPDAILANGAKCATAQFFRFDVVRLEPQLLQFEMILGLVIVRFEYFVQIAKVALVKVDDRLRLHYCLLLLELLAFRQ